MRCFTLRENACKSTKDVVEMLVCRVEMHCEVKPILNKVGYLLYILRD